MKQHYQGDISLIKGKLSDFVQKLKLDDLEFQPFSKRLIVAEGETTGHKHAITAERDSEITFAETQLGWLFNIKAGEAVITHEEHGAQVLTKGTWFVQKHQFEYDEIAERRVLD